MQRVESQKEEQMLLNQNASQYLSKNILMHCQYHKYEQICYVNITQNDYNSKKQDDSISFNHYDHNNSDQDDSDISDDNINININNNNNEIKFNSNKQQQQQYDEIQSDNSNGITQLNTRFLCAECILEIDIDKSNLIPLRKLVYNQSKLYNNWPPLENGLNKKIFDILKVDKDKNESMIEIDKICSGLIEQFTSLINSLKKDLLRIEGERFSILSDLQELYENISNIDTFSNLLSKTAANNNNNNNINNNPSNSNANFNSGSSSSSATAAAVQNNPQSTQNQTQSLLSEIQNNLNTAKDAYQFDSDLFSNNNNNFLDLNLLNSSQQQQQQQSQQQQPLMVIRSSSQNASSNPPQPQQNQQQQQQQQQNKIPKQIDLTRKKIDDFIEDKYQEKRQNSQNLNKFVMQLNKFKPLEENLNNLKEFGNMIQSKLQQFSNQIKYKLNLTDFSMQKSQFKNSNLLQINRNELNQITVHTEGHTWGQVYSDFLIDNNSTYQFVFQFKSEVQNFIIIGLIPDQYKDQISQGSSQNHFGKIFGQENITYCGSVIKGDSQLSFLRRNDIIMMEVCVAKNHLTFSDYPNQQNITQLHSDYSLNPHCKYRICIEFYDFDEENTITIIDAKQF